MDNAEAGPRGEGKGEEKVAVNGVFLYSLKIVDTWNIGGWWVISVRISQFCESGMDVLALGRMKNFT